MTEYEVVVVGGGPTGLVLAGELALAGARVAIVERRASQGLESLRAGGLQARTLELLDQRGIVDRFVSEGRKMQIVAVARVPLDISDFPTRHNYGLALWQRHIERILLHWVNELGVPIHRGKEVTGLTEYETDVELELSDGTAQHADYVVGCDGGRSTVRKLADIEFPGWDASTSYLIGEVRMAQEPEWGMRRGAKGVYGIGKHEDGERARVVLCEDQVGEGEPSIEELRQAIVAVYGTDYGLQDATYVARFTDMARQAHSYRRGRVLLAGDAAHVHSPIGGQGLNTGVQDAFNLGWKLAQVVQGISADELLDTYHAERHPVGARVLQNTLAFTALDRGDARSEALRDSLVPLLRMDGPRKHYAGMLSGLDIQYELGVGHPLLGRRMPDLDLEIGGAVRPVYSFLQDGRAVLLQLSGPTSLDCTPWQRRVRCVNATFDGSWELPVSGRVAAPSAVLIRPDGYVAWVGEGSEVGLREALEKWFGKPA